MLGKGPTSFSYMWISRFPSTICWEDCSFSVESFVTLVKNHLVIHMKVYFRVLYSISWVYMYVFMPVPHYSDYCSFAVCFEVIKCKALLFFKIVLATQVSLKLLWILNVKLLKTMQNIVEIIIPQCHHKSFPPQQLKISM